MYIPPSTQHKVNHEYNCFRARLIGHDKRAEPYYHFVLLLLLLTSTLLSYSLENILDVDEGINSNPFPHEKYGQGQHIGTSWGS